MSTVKITSANTIQIDENSRDKIVCNPPYNNYLDKNLFVIAGAGSGKTSMLVSRMVKMVESGIDVSKICAITFTKKAAAEFLERFQKELKNRSTKPYPRSKNRPGDLPTPTDLTAFLCKKALKDIDLCFTGTIDSFCNLVLSEYPNNAHVPSSSVVVMDDELIELCKKEYKNISNHPSHPLKDKCDVFNQLFSNGADVFAKSIKDVMDLIHLNIVHDVPSKSAETALKELEKIYRIAILNDLNIVNGSKASVVDFPAFNEAFDNFTRQYNNLRKDWTVNNIRYLPKSLSSALSNIRFIDQPTFMFFDTQLKNKSTRNGVTREAGYEIVFKDNAFEEFKNKIQEFIYLYALDFLVSAANDIRNELKKQGKLSFNEYLVTFKDMVKDDMSKGMHLINHIRNKHQYFLLDESQDTSPVQTELFLYLCSQTPASKIEDCKPIPGSLFIVGDPKQSIYGFRGADVDAYLHTKSLFEGVYDQNSHEVVYLTKNFRSSFELCEYFNAQFKNLDNYDPIPTSCIDLAPHQIRSDVLTGLYGCENHLEAIKSLVGKHYLFDKGLLAEEENLLKEDSHAFDHKPRTYGKRLIEYKDIMLLTWSTTNHNRTMEELNNEHIPVFCEGRFLINKCEILQTIYAIYAYLCDEEGALANLLASPLLVIKPNDLAVIDTVDDLPSCPQKDFLKSVEPLKEINNPILLLDAIIRQMTLYDFVDFINIEYVTYALETLKEAYNSGQISDTKSALEFLKEYVVEKLERCANLEKKPNAVFLANVHKVKGLERPIVILVESFANPRKPNTYSHFQEGVAYIFRTSEYETSYNLKLYDIDSGTRFLAEEDVATKKSSEEEERLGYVAVTRARNVLVIPPQSQANSVWRNIRPNEPLPNIPSSDLTNPDPDKVYGFNPSIFGAFNNQSTYNEVSPSQQTNTQNRQAINPVNVNNANSDETIKGTVVHRLMQMLVNSKGQINQEVMVNSTLNEFYLEKGSVYETILNDVYKTINNGGYPQKNSVVEQDILKVLLSAKDVRCELPFSFSDNNNIVSGVIDLIYEDENGFHIIDYKTNKETDVKVLEKEYRGQLNCYVKAAKMFGFDADAHIYHIAIKE